MTAWSAFVLFAAAFWIGFVAAGVLKPGPRERLEWIIELPQDQDSYIDHGLFLDGDEPVCEECLIT